MNHEELRLKPDLSIVFERKEALKRPVSLAAPQRTGSARRLQLWSSVAAAAVVALAVVFALRPDAPIVPEALPELAARVEIPIDAQPVVVEQSVQVAVSAQVERMVAHRKVESMPEERQFVEREPLASVGASTALIAMTPVERPLTLQMVRSVGVAEQPVAEKLREMTLAGIDRNRPRQLLDELGERSIVAFNRLIANEKTMVTKTYDSEGNLTNREVTSLGISMNRNY